MSNQLTLFLTRAKHHCGCISLLQGESRHRHTVTTELIHVQTEAVLTFRRLALGLACFFTCNNPPTSYPGKGSGLELKL